MGSVNEKDDLLLALLGDLGATFYGAVAPRNHDSLSLIDVGGLIQIGEFCRVSGGRKGGIGLERRDAACPCCDTS